MYYVYILYSNSLNEYYCGQTKDLSNRLQRHNSGETSSIKHGTPWKLIGFLEVETRSEAMRLEKQVKSRGIGRWLTVHQHDLVKPR